MRRPESGAPGDQTDVVIPGTARPEGLRYATFKLPDGVTFVHVAEHGDDNPLPKLASFQRFQEGSGERCDELPAPAALSEIGPYRMLGDGQ